MQFIFPLKPPVVHAHLDFYSDQLTDLYKFINLMDPNTSLSRKKPVEIPKKELELASMFRDYKKEKKANNTKEANNIIADMCEATVRINNEPILVYFAPRVKFHFATITAEYNRIKGRKLDLASPQTNWMGPRTLNTDLSFFEGDTEVLFNVSSSSSRDMNTAQSHIGSKAMNLSVAFP